MSSLQKNSIEGGGGLSSKLQKGFAALLPTDTLPALASCPEYASQLWEIKQRPANKPLILMGSSPDELFACVSKNALKDAWVMARRYWPGALTMVLPARGPIVTALNPGKTNLGMRIPACQPTIELLAKSGPLATTSANISGEHPLLNAEEVANCFPNLPLLGPVPWPKASGLASTLIMWCQQGSWQVLRSGAVIIENDRV